MTKNDNGKRAKTRLARSILEILSLSGSSELTIDQLVKGNEGTMFAGVGSSASEARRALGWLYGRGLVRVVRLDNELEVWGRTNQTQRTTR